MRGALAILLSILYLNSIFAQSGEAFKKFGPHGAEIYKDLKLALKIGSGVYRMDLSYQEVDPKLFKKIGKLKNLQALQLSSNGLTEFPADFSKLNSLMYFSSINNNFSTFPPEMKGLENLVYLEFFGCKIDSIPNDIASLTKLNVLHLGNTIDTIKITTKLKYLHNLEELLFESVTLDSCPAPLFKIPSLKYINITSTTMQALPQNLDKLSNLEVLILDNNKLSEIPRSIYNCTKMIHLSLKNNNLKKIPDTICHLQNLAKLDLRGNSIDPVNIEELKILLPETKILY